jgi:hypothetical protein
MDPVFIAKCIAIRQATAEGIKSMPTLYKVCEGCGGIAKVDQFICPACHSYRFDTSRARLIEVCDKIGDQPFPSYPATTPRLPGLIKEEPPTPIEIHE